MSKTWEVSAQSPELEAQGKNIWQTKNIKQDKMWIMHKQIQKPNYQIHRNFGNFFLRNYFLKKKKLKKAMYMH